MNEPEPNPHIAENNAREDGRQQTWDHHRNDGLKLRDNQAMRLDVLGAIEDKARLDWLIEHGATWQIPFVKDGPLDFHRGSIDDAMRHLF